MHVCLIGLDGSGKFGSWRVGKGEGQIWSWMVRSVKLVFRVESVWSSLKKNSSTGRWRVVYIPESEGTALRRILVSRDSICATISLSNFALSETHFSLCVTNFLWESTRASHGTEHLNRRVGTFGGMGIQHAISRKCIRNEHDTRMNRPGGVQRERENSRFLRQSIITSEGRVNP